MSKIETPKTSMEPVRAPVQARRSIKTELPPLKRLALRLRVRSGVRAGRSTPS
jgi:hypothetical protein